MRTREELEAAINEGGSVLVGGKIITRLEDLPSEADLAKGDEVKEAAARKGLEDQVKALQAELAKLQKGDDKTLATTKTSGDKDPKDPAK
jgi:hypothetical protein